MWKPSVEDGVAPARTASFRSAQRRREAAGEGEVSGQPTIQHIIEAVTRYYDIKLSDLMSKRRHKSVALPRQICMWLARKHTRYSLEEIGGYFGGRDHTTVMHAVEKIGDLMKERRQIYDQVTELTQSIRSGS